MVDYSIFPLDEEIKDKLAKLEISYAFQPIFYPDGKDIYAYEAKGVCEEECSEMLTTFFKELRKNKKKNTPATTDGE